MAAGTVVHATIAVAAAPSVSVVIYATAVRSVCVHVFPQFGASCNYMMLRTHSSTAGGLTQSGQCYHA